MLNVALGNRVSVIGMQQLLIEKVLKMKIELKVRLLCSTCVKERTSLVSTPSLAELYRFAMNFLLVKKRKRKRNRDGRKRGKLREEVKVKRTHAHG